MFGPNQGNRVCSIDEAAKKLRAKLSEASDSRKEWYMNGIDNNDLFI